MKLTYRLLAAQFAESVASSKLSADASKPSPKANDLANLATATVQLANEAGLNDTMALIAAIEQELLSRYGMAEVQVTTAHKLSAAQVADVTTQIAGAIGADHVSAVTSEDPDLIGGFEATAAGYAIHGSIQSSLKTVGAQHG